MPGAPFFTQTTVGTPRSWIQFVEAQDCQPPYLLSLLVPLPIPRMDGSSKRIAASLRACVKTRVRKPGTHMNPRCQTGWEPSCNSPFGSKSTPKSTYSCPRPSSFPCPEVLSPPVGPLAPERPADLQRRGKHTRQQKQFERIRASKRGRASRFGSSSRPGKEKSRH